MKAIVLRRYGNFKAVTFPLPALAALQALRDLGNIKSSLKGIDSWCFGLCGHFGG